MKKESNSWFGERNLHFSSWKIAIVKLSNGSEAILKAVELNQCHILISWLLQDMDILHLSIFLEDAPQDLLPTYLLFERGNMQGLWWRVDCYGFGGRESMWCGFIPIIWGIEVDELAKLILFRNEIFLILSVGQFEAISHKIVFVEIGERDSCELEGSEFDVDGLPFLADAGYVAEIAEKIVDVSDLDVSQDLEEENGTVGTRIVFQFYATWAIWVGVRVRFNYFFCMVWHFLAFAGVRIGVENGFDVTFDFKIKLIFFTNFLILW